MARDGSQRGVARAFAEQMRRVGEAKSREARKLAFDALARDVIASGSQAIFLQRLLAGDANSQRFALEVASRLSAPLPSDLVAPLLKLVGKTTYPSRTRIALAALILQSIPASSPLVGQTLDALEKKVSRKRAADRMRRLEELVSPLGIVTQRREELSSATMKRCPRCDVRLERPDLIRHLWEQHRLLYDRGKAREPWHVVETWLAEYTQAPNSDLLNRCCDLAQALDPATGLTRVHQLLLASGTGDQEAHDTLRAEAAEKNASLCPNCFALVPSALGPQPKRVIVGPGLVDGEGYRVELADQGLFTRLVIESPSGPVFRGREPGRSLTRRGAVILMVFPLVALAIGAAFLPTFLGIPPLVPVIVCLLMAMVIYTGSRIAIDDRGDLTGRTVDYAWEILVPALLNGELRHGSVAFIAGLAQSSIGRGQIGPRQELLDQSIANFESKRVSLSMITALHVLHIEDRRAAGSDDLPLMMDQIGTSFEGRLPLDHAEAIVQHFRIEATNHARRARLRILVVARAFQAGLEPEDLRYLGRLYPQLGTSYASEDRNGLARLRLLWLYRSRRLWQRVGSATSAFDLARYPTLSDLYLRKRPDLLLFQPSGDSDVTSDPILICEEGIIFREAIMRSDTQIRIKASKSGFDLVIGSESYSFRDDPTNLANRINAWADFLFNEFLPRAKQLGRRRSTQGDRLLNQKAITCPECRQSFLARSGEIGFMAPSASDEEDE